MALPAALLGLKALEEAESPVWTGPGYIEMKDCTFEEDSFLSIPGTYNSSGAWRMDGNAVVFLGVDGSTYRMEAGEPAFKVVS